jgi:hypothetical protein
VDIGGEIMPKTTMEINSMLANVSPYENKEECERLIGLEWYSKDELDSAIKDIVDISVRREEMAIINHNNILEQLRKELVEHEEGILTYNTANHVNNVFDKFRGMK